MNRYSTKLISLYYQFESVFVSVVLERKTTNLMNHMTQMSLLAQIIQTLRILILYRPINQPISEELGEA